MIVSGEQQRDSIIRIHVFIFPKPPSHSGCRITLIGVPWLYNRSLLAIHLKYSSVYRIFPKSLTIPSLQKPFSSLSKSVSLSVLQVYLYHFFLYSTYKGCHMRVLLLWLISLSMTISRSIHVAANGIISFMENITLLLFLGQQR